MRVRGHRVVVEQTDEGFRAHVPDLPGCVAVAATSSAAVTAIVPRVAFRLGEKRVDESSCTCSGLLARHDGCPVHGRRETREELEALRSLKEAVHGLSWNVLDGYDRASPALVERNSFNNMRAALARTGRRRRCA